MTTRRFQGNEKSHSAVVTRGVAGGRLPSLSSQVGIIRGCVNTLELASPDTAAIGTTQRPTATVIVGVPQIVSLLCLFCLQDAESSSWKVATEELVADAMSIMQKANISAMTENVHVSSVAKNATLSSAFRAMPGR